MNYSWFRDDAVGYGIVNVSVANIRAYSVFQSELVNQSVLGTIVSILDKRDDFFLIQNRDGYIGWMSKHALTPVDETVAENWEKAEKVIITTSYGLVYREPDERSFIISDLVPCVFLKKVESLADFLKIELPDGQNGFIRKNGALPEADYRKIQISGEKIVEQARKFLGIPYLWGGNSSKGFDCSGFVQTVFRLLNVELPRDSGPMSRVGTTIPLTEPQEDFKIGDLVFFGKTPSRINHVGIYIGDEVYIHSRGKVRLNSFNEKHPLYEAYLKSLFVKVQRVI